MEQTYAPQKQQETASPEKKPLESQGPSMAALRTGAAMPTPGQKGQQVNLPDAMRAKMENAFGADLSAVKLYESKTVADAGAQAVTRGTEIAFAPGMLDFGSSRGQALLGHEISHVVSQARGEVSRSGGFLNDSALEARADREGAMAAAGQQIAMPTAALSTVTAAPAAGPMQAKKDEEEAGKPGSITILPEGQPGTEGGQDPRGSLAFPSMDDDSFNAKTMNWQMQSVSQHLQDHEQKINALQSQVAQMQSSFQTQMSSPFMGMMGMGMDMSMGMMPQQGGSPPAVDDEIMQALQAGAQTQAAADAQEQGTLPAMPMRANDEEYGGDIDELAQSTEKFDAQPLSQTTNPRRKRRSLIGRNRSDSVS